MARRGEFGSLLLVTLLLCQQFVTGVALDALRGGLLRSLEGDSSVAIDEGPPSNAVTKTDCSWLSKSILASEDAPCVSVLLAANASACVCNIQLPRNMKPMPDTFSSPAHIWIDNVAGFTTFAPVATLAPPVDPRAASVVVENAPRCPFSTNCTETRTPGCVGFDTFGFRSVHMGAFTSNTGHFNTISCRYTLDVNGTFQVPPKVQQMLVKMSN
mmetsp:Transcript_68786/g.174787  ORF Transcript_68786/g.174787 Transcript_68786/m.174787 type:complete len:214 (+) Transcript_68786:100-741(+)